MSLTLNNAGETTSSIVSSHILPGEYLQGQITTTGRVCSVLPIGAESSAYTFLMEFQHFRRPVTEKDDYYPFVGYKGTFRVIVADQGRGLIYLSRLSGILRQKVEEWTRVNPLLYRSYFRDVIMANFYFNLTVLRVGQVIAYFSVLPRLREVEEFDREV